MGSLGSVSREYREDNERSGSGCPGRYLLFVLLSV